MKMNRCVFAGMLLAAVPLAAAPQYLQDDPYATLERFNFSAKKGEWNKASNWKEGKVPEGFVRVQIPAGAVVTVSGPLYNVESVNVGWTQGDPAVMYVEKGAQAKCSLLVVPALGQKDVRGELYLRGGEISVGNDKEGGGLLAVGYGSTYSGNGYAEVSGGKFRGGMKVGNDAPDTQTGTLVVKGEAPDIATNKNVNNFLSIGASGTLVFELDAKGVAGMHYQGAHVYLSPGALIRVDGKHYKGGSKTITLMEADSIAYEGARLETVNFPPDCKASVAWQIRDKAHSLQLKIVSRRQ